MIEIPIHDDSYSVSHAETQSAEYNRQTPNNSPIGFTMPETEALTTNMINDFYRSNITRGRITSLLSFRTYCVPSTIADST